jgi:hypothetical protein
MTPRTDAEAATQDVARLKAELEETRRLYRVQDARYAELLAGLRAERDALKAAVEQARNLTNAAAVVENVLRGYAVDQHEDVPERKALALADSLAAALRAPSPPEPHQHRAACWRDPDGLGIRLVCLPPEVTR